MNALGKKTESSPLPWHGRMAAASSSSPPYPSSSPKWTPDCMYVADSHVWSC